MNQKNELMVGLTVIVAIVVVIAAVLFLGDMRPGGADRIETARFRTVGGLSVGNPVVLRGVRVGRVEAVRLAADDWVETDLRISADAVLPDQPVAIAASASLFGEWLVSVLSSERAPDDPQIQLQLDEARPLPGDIWPGATLPVSRNCSTSFHK